MPAVATGPAAELKSVNPLFSTGWDEQVQRHPESTIFHTGRWARVLHESYSYRPFYRISDEEQPAAICLFEVNSWLTGRRGVGLPFTDECQPLSTDDHSFEALFEHGLQIGRDRGWKTLEIRGVSGSSRLSPSLSFYTHDLDLRRSPEELFASFDPAIRRGVRKARNSDLRVTFEHSEEALRQYFSLHCLTRRKHGLPPQPLRFFQSIHRHIIQPGFGFIALTKRNQMPIAGAIYFLFQDSALYKFGASDPDHDSLRPNNLLMWESIRHLLASGVTTLNFGRTSIPNEGLRRYKLNWGSRERLTQYIKWNFELAACVQDTDHSTGWQNRFFRLFPRPVSRLAGSLLYPHIA